MLELFCHILSCKLGANKRLARLALIIKRKIKIHQIRVLTKDIVEQVSAAWTLEIRLTFSMKDISLELLSLQWTPVGSGLHGHSQFLWGKGLILLLIIIGIILSIRTLPKVLPGCWKIVTTAQKGSCRTPSPQIIQPAI